MTGELISREIGGFYFIEQYNKLNIMEKINITAFTSDYVAMSEPLCGTSNRVFTSWVICTFFKIENNTPTAHFEIRDKMFSSNILFETNSYKELEEWISAHSEEIQKQIEQKKKEWIDNYQSR